MLNLTLKLFLFIATLIYGAFFTYTFLSPQSIEKDAREFIKKEIAKKSFEKIDNIGAKFKDNKLVKLSKKLLKKKYKKLENYKEMLREKVHTKTALVVAKMRNLDCKCRQKYAKFFKDTIFSKIRTLTLATKKLEEFMSQKYMQIVQNIINDFKIFTGINFVILLLLTLLLFTKPKLNREINLLALLMFLSTLICSYFYLFEQDWFYTLLYSDFVGYSYLGYVALIFLFLCDIVFNEARVTEKIVNTILNAIGNVLSC